MIETFSKHMYYGRTVVVSPYDRVVEFQTGERVSSPPEYILVDKPVPEEDLQFRRTLIFDDGELGDILYLMHARFPNGYKIEISRLGKGIIGDPFSYSVKYWSPKGEMDILCLIHHIGSEFGLLNVFDFMRAKAAGDADVCE